MNERTAFHHIRLGFRPDFGKSVGTDMVREVARLRAESPTHPASAVLVQWHGEAPVSTARLIQHPPGVVAPVALVAGRHSRCDLGSIPGASLRHALMLFWPPAESLPGDTDPDDPLPSAEVIDLGTATGLTLVDGRAASRIVSSAPIRFGVASADVVVLHARAGETFPENLPEQLEISAPSAEVSLHGDLPHTRHLDIFAGRELANRDLASGEPEKTAGSCIKIPVEAMPLPAIGSEHAMLTQIIQLDETRYRARVEVREKDLRQGIRLGRYQRCRGSSVLGRDGRVSRVHALVLERRGRRWLFDTASTNGTQVYDLDAGTTVGPVRGERTFALLDGQAPQLAGQVALLDVGAPELPS